MPASRAGQVSYKPPLVSTALRCRDLIKRFDGLVAVDGLSLEIRGGECFGLLGPNGAGKTTTVEIFEGLQVPDSGEVEVLGERWRGDGLALRRRLGIQLQETKFPEKLRTREVITLFRSFYRRGPDPGEVLGLVGLEEKAEAIVRTLSGGQKQRLSLACALVGDPEVLFLDEPTTGLDPASRRDLWTIVETLALVRSFFSQGPAPDELVGLVQLDDKRNARVGTLSGGQKQRLALAVALVGQPELLFLDEPTTGLDPQARRQVWDFIESLRKSGRTIVLTTHYMEEATRLADRVAIMDHGKVIAVGTPAELIASIAGAGVTLEDVFVALTGRHLRDE